MSDNRIDFLLDKLNDNAGDHVVSASLRSVLSPLVPEMNEDQRQRFAELVEPAPPGFPGGSARKI